MSKKNTIKVIGIIDDNHITGIRYGLVEITVPSEKLPVPHVVKKYEQTKKSALKKMRNNKTRNK